MGSKVNFAKDKFAVIGLGDTGISIINYLKYQQAQIVRVFDTRDNPPHQELVDGLKLYTGKLQECLLDEIDVIVISPGISIYEPVLQNALHRGKQVIGDIELFAQAIVHWDCKIIGITGSNGKTTVTSLTGFLASTYGINTLVAGNIGVPVLSSYLTIVKESLTIPELIVLELSSFQLESTYSLELDAATVLNISEDHLDRYRDLLEYAYVKANIFNHCKIQVLNIEDQFVRAMARSKEECLWFGANSNQFSLKRENGTLLLQCDAKTIIDSSELNLVGVHNYLNCLASIALLKGVGIDVYQAKIQQGLRDFKGLEHRMQKVTTHNGIVYIEDSKGTNVGAVVAGVSGLDGMVNLILGGDGKGQDFSPLRELVENKCRSVAIIGQDKLLIEQVLKGLNLPIKCLVSLEDAVKFCMAHAKSGDYVVLSPACASWDMFNNYKHRAQVFIDCIYDNIK